MHQERHVPHSLQHFHEVRGRHCDWLSDHDALRAVPRHDMEYPEVQFHVTSEVRHVRSVCKAGHSTFHKRQPTAHFHADPPQANFRQGQPYLLVWNLSGMTGIRHCYSRTTGTTLGSRNGTSQFRPRAVLKAATPPLTPHHNTSAAIFQIANAIQSAPKTAHPITNNGLRRQRFTVQPNNRISAKIPTVNSVPATTPRTTPNAKLMSSRSNGMAGSLGGAINAKFLNNSTAGGAA